jgi:hypothetical protein
MNPAEARAYPPSQVHAIMPRTRMGEGAGPR